MVFLGSFTVGTETSTTTTTISGTVGVNLNQRREGTQTSVTEQIDTSSLGDRIVSREVIHFMRSRNIQFTTCQEYETIYTSLWFL